MEDTSTEQEPQKNGPSYIKLDSEGRDENYNPHDPKTQLWALLLLASGQDGRAFTQLVEPAQRALMVTAYEKALSALHPSSIEE